MGPCRTLWAPICFFYLFVRTFYFTRVVRTRPLFYLSMPSSSARCDAQLEAQLYPESPPPSVSSFPGEAPPKRHPILRLREDFDYEIIRTHLVLPLIARVNQIRSDQSRSDLDNLPLAVPGSRASINSIVDILLETDLNNPLQSIVGSQRTWNIIPNFSAMNAFPASLVYGVYSPVYPDVFIAGSGTVDFSQPVVLGIGGREVEVGKICEVGADFVMVRVRELGVLGVGSVRRMLILEAFTRVPLSFLQRLRRRFLSRFLRSASDFHPSLPSSYSDILDTSTEMGTIWREGSIISEDRGSIHSSESGSSVMSFGRIWGVILGAIPGEQISDDGELEEENGDLEVV